MKKIELRHSKKTMQSTLRKIEGTLEKGENESVRMKGVKFEYYLDILLNGTTLNGDYYDKTIFSLFRDSVLCNFKENAKLNIDSIMNTFNQKLHEKYHIKEDKFIVIGELIYNSTVLPTNFEINDCKVTFSYALEAKIKEERNNTIVEFDKNATLEKKGNVYFSIESIAGDVDVAILRSEKTINIFRCIVSLNTKRNINILHADDMYRNSVFPSVGLGKHLTAHGSSVSSDKRLWSVNTNQRNVTINIKDYTSFYAMIMEDIDRLKQHSFKEQLSELFLMYIDAIEAHSSADKFIRLSQVVESASHSYKTEDIIKVMTSRYKDPDEEKFLISHLREIRNRFVHAGYIAPKLDMNLYHLNKFILNQLEEYLMNFCNADSLDDIIKIYSYSNKPEVLRAEIEKLKHDVNLKEKAIKLHS
ncbi:TPA: hypothetical protein ACSTJ0_002001 [Serratia fonticola]|uniref:hypothetical protein n=1 Tax=Serratia fonticola TaxID=47917 RepID=UPI0021777FFD|nr:hypothetical protein [Serratia fonticola]CAI0806536.1 Uncharacterised protein [Serratia fonticola]CAI1882631.1 Uncharacterised protein [Serratia fonticola]